MMSLACYAPEYVEGDFSDFALRAFSARLREETDLDVLSNDLVGVASRTVQPEHASVWLRPDTATRGRQAD